MPPTPPPAGPVRSSAAVNAEIRALWPDPRVPLYGASRERYELLVAEWTLAVAAERAEMATAA